MLQYRKHIEQDIAPRPDSIKDTFVVSFVVTSHLTEVVNTLERTSGHIMSHNFHTVKATYCHMVRIRVTASMAGKACKPASYNADLDNHAHELQKGQ